MNTFYERLEKFGTLIHDVSERSGEDLGNQFIVIHPSYPVINHTRSTRPSIKFEQSCPLSTRRQVRQLLRKAFGGRSEV